MSGNTHKAIGTVTGVAMLIYGVQTNQPLYALGMVTAPIGAMLPDIDHNSTVIGSKRKKVVDVAKVILLIGLILAGTISVFGLWSGYLQMVSGLPILVGVGLIIVVWILLTTDTIKRKIKFLTKHRGIMHTLFVPVAMYLFSTKITDEALSALLLGLMFGYLSHLLSDGITTEGVPIAWPLSEKDIHPVFGLKVSVKQDVKRETAWARFLSLLILATAYMLGVDSRTEIILMSSLVGIIIGQGIVKVKVGKTKNSTITKIVKVLVICGTAFVCYRVDSLHIGIVGVVTAINMVIGKLRSKGK